MVLPTSSATTFVSHSSKPSLVASCSNRGFVLTEHLLETFVCATRSLALSSRAPALLPSSWAYHVRVVPDCSLILLFMVAEASLTCNATTSNNSERYSNSLSEALHEQRFA